MVTFATSTKYSAAQRQMSSMKQALAILIASEGSFGPEEMQAHDSFISTGPEDV